MAEYTRLLSQRVAAYASEINRLKALVAKLQRMQFGKSSEKLRAKTERQIQEAQERISALQEESGMNSNLPVQRAIFSSQVQPVHLPVVIDYPAALALRQMALVQDELPKYLLGRK